MRIVRPLLVVAALGFTLLAGCHAMNWNPMSPHAAEHHPRPVPFQAKAKAEKPSWLSSWFVKEEPEPPKTMKEWMDLDPVRP